VSLKHNFLNIHNYLSIVRIFLIFQNPFHFICCVVLKKVPNKINIKTPIGKISLFLRNFESLKTIFSVFCREDYISSSEKSHYIDLGSNCGYSAIYFLTRNNQNTIDCYEPEKENLKYLKKNLRLFSQRSNIYKYAIGIKKGREFFYTSADGKYSSLLKKKSQKRYKVNVISFNSLLKKIDIKKKTQIKIDIEGMEKKIIKKINFKRYKNISKLIIESKDCSKLIKKFHERLLINGYIEHLYFK
jgi:FkbM family methyltransferase